MAFDRYPCGGGIATYGHGIQYVWPEVRSLVSVMDATSRTNCPHPWGSCLESAIVSVWARVKLSGKIVFPLLSFIVWQMVMKYVDFQVRVVGRVEIGCGSCINQYTFDGRAAT
jgi:hypothetical protein